MNDLEKKVLNFILSEDNDEFSLLREQLSCCEVVRRERTGRGFFTYLEVDRERCQSMGSSNLQLGSVGAHIKGLEHGAGFLLFVEDGFLTMLEGYSYGESWPELEKYEFELYPLKSE